MIIASPTTSVGKTSLTIALTHHYVELGKLVQIFKCGPDFIDPMLHTQISGRPAINLDAILMSESHIKMLYSKYSKGVDIVLVEGMMGLFDGSHDDFFGSTAHIARILDLPITLIIDAQLYAYSVSALLYGFKSYDPTIRLEGVLFNNIYSDGHYQLLKKSTDKVGVKSLGFVKPNDEIKIESRHLGLHFEQSEDVIVNLSKHFCTNIDFNVVELLQEEKNLIDINVAAPLNPSYTISVARDEAFNFLYEENLNALKSFATLKYFSPINNEEVPECDMIYFCGGYPERFLYEISNANIFLNSLKSSSAKIFAECGGMMILGKSIKSIDGREFSMAGLINTTFDFTEKSLTIGYRTIRSSEGKFSGSQCNGHEFHLSKSEIIKNNNTFDLRDTNDESKLVEHFYDGRIFASYTHFYWAERKSFIRRFLI